MGLTRQLKKDCNQPVVYWAPGPEDSHGQSSYGAPVQLYAQWEDVNEQFLDRTNNVRLSKAKVYTYYAPSETTNRVEVKELGVLWRGELGDVADTDPVDPFVNTNAFEVRRVDKDPDRKGDQFVYTAFM